MPLKDLLGVGGIFALQQTTLWATLHAKVVKGTEKTVDHVFQVFTRQIEHGRDKVTYYVDAAAVKHIDSTILECQQSLFINESYHHLTAYINDFNGVTCPKKRLISGGVTVDRTRSTPGNYDDSAMFEDPMPVLQKSKVKDPVQMITALRDLRALKEGGTQKVMKYVVLACIGSPDDEHQVQTLALASRMANGRGMKRPNSTHVL